MAEVRMGVIGAGGGMARSHLGYYKDIGRLKFTAASDVDSKAVEAIAKQYQVEAFTDGYELIKSGLVDAIFIATPHYFHPTYAKAGFEAGLHVLTEKPVAVTAQDAYQVNEAYAQARARKPDLVYGAMFHLRSIPVWKKVKQLITQGQLGTLTRVSWTVTDWFRTQAYYDAGGWRATWKGEGGGVLLNQNPHILDLLQWFAGMPRKVIAMAALGKHHRIEVEDEVIAMFEFDNGAIGQFTTSTGEAPGINRLELVGDKSTLLVEHGKIIQLANTVSVSQYSRTASNVMALPPYDTITIALGEQVNAHQAITENFVAAILDGQPLIAPGTEGARSLELGNAMLLSGLNGSKPIDLPMDQAEFGRMFADLLGDAQVADK